MKDHRVTFFKLISDILLHKNTDQKRYYIICLALCTQGHNVSIFYQLYIKSVLILTADLD